ncbi:hypothetical protein TcasGA2_TC034066 [Tribolium castaneum]|uniref:Protein sleepless n=1 Tax=Tribolium castaneum TaxID=7070 RepID=A0A139WD19_TRICA|nr:PREDICTED: uncharacterized protein LOC103313961 [Tribolium castaneum]KYB25833.1 hypothetical protein TcasGA2_TC034066 [Tribolium castaneum]|eukprot:XP_008196823.1 PREDICTED: uncharacterized protein LOC103313961 [Tribolium castaneum]
MPKLTLVFVLSVLIFNTVGALRCYQCTHPTDESCDVTSECLFKCGKYTIKYPDSELLFQGCYLDNQCEIMENTYAQNPVVSVKDCRMCETDLCNNSASKMQNIALLVIGIVGFYYVL